MLKFQNSPLIYLHITRLTFVAPASWMVGHPAVHNYCVGKLERLEVGRYPVGWIDLSM